MVAAASLAPPRADATGLTLADLLDRARLSSDWRVFPEALGYVLRDEIAWGRVVLDDGVYRLVPDAFDSDVLAGLRALAMVDF